MRNTLTGLAIAALTAALMGGTAMANEITITGDISYRERIALPENAIATVSLIDVSLADAPAQTLAQHVIDPAGQVPIGFILALDTDALEDGHSYAIAARIEVDGALWFINDTRVAIDPAEHDAPISVSLVNARGMGNTPAEPEAGVEAATLPGTGWALVALDGQAVPEGVEATLTFGTEDGGVGGMGGCNSFGGTIAYEDDGGIDISEVFSTMMACEDPKMETERGFFAALDAATGYSIEGETLILIDADGTVVAELTAQASE